MAVAYKTYVGAGSATSSGTTVSITTTAAIDVDDLVVVRVASDNLSATTPTFTCVDGGNTYTVLRQGAVNATAAAGVAGAILATRATVARPIGSLITVTLSGNVNHKATYAESFTGVFNTVRSTPVGATGTATAASAGASGTVNAGDLVLGMIANETRGTITGDSDTLNGSWSAQNFLRSATSGSDATCVTTAGQYKIATASGAQTYNVTAVGAEWLCQCVVLQADPAITLAVGNASHAHKASSISFGVPAEIPDLYQWYDAADASSLVMAGSQVAEWRDKSDNLYFVGAGSTEQPTLVADVLKPGRSAIQFATSKWLTGGLNTGANQKPLTLFAALKHNGTTDRAIVGTNTVGGLMWGFTTTSRQVINKQYVVALSTSTTPVPPNFPAILCVSYSATGEVRFYLNNVLDGVATNNQTFDGVNPATLIGDGIAQGIGDAAIGEIVKYSRVLSDAERLQVFDYLNARWVPLPPVELVVDSCAHAHAADNVTVEHIAPIVITPDDCFHSHVSQQPAEHYLNPALGSASTPDPGTISTDEWTIVSKLYGPIKAVGTDHTLVRQGTASPNYSFRWVRRGVSGGFIGYVSATGTSNTGPLNGPGFDYGALPQDLAIAMRHRAGQTTQALGWISRDGGATWPTTVTSFDSTQVARPFDTTSPVLVGDDTGWTGRIYSIEMRLGWGPTAGTVLWRFDVADHVSGTSWTDPRGQTWTLTNAAAAVHVAANPNVTIIETPAVPLVVQNCQHNFVNQTDFTAWLEPLVSRATTPDPATLPADGFIFVVKALGPMAGSGNYKTIVSQNRGDPNRSFKLRRYGQYGYLYQTAYPTGLNASATDSHAGSTLATVDLNNFECWAASYNSTTGAWRTLRSTDNGANFTQVVTSTDASPDAYFNSSDIMTIGADGTGATDIWDGRIWWVELRTGNDPKAGTLLWRFDANDHVSGTGWTDPRGNVWTLTSAAAVVRPVTDTPTITVFDPNLKPQDCFHTVVSQQPGGTYLDPAVAVASTPATTPDLPVPAGDITWVFKVNGPFVSSGIVPKYLFGQWAGGQFAYTAGRSPGLNYFNTLTSANGTATVSKTVTVPKEVGGRCDEFIALTYPASSAGVSLWRSYDGVNWVLEATGAALANAVIFNSSASIAVGNRDTTTPTTKWEGRVYWVEMRTGSDGPTTGSVLWRFDAAEASGTSYTDPRGLTWTLTAAGGITTVPNASDVTITQEVAPTPVVQDAQHVFVEQNDLNAFLATNYNGRSYETVTTPDPGPLPTDGFVIVAKALGPIDSARLGLVAQYGNDGNRSFHLERFGSGAAAASKGDVRLTAFPAGTTAGSINLGDQDTQTVDTANAEFFAMSYNATTGAWRTLVSTNGGTNYAQVASGAAVATGFFDSSDVLRVGALTSGSGRWIGLIYWVELRSGNDPVGGTLLWRFDVNEHVAGLSWVDIRGRTWTSTTSAAGFVHPNTTVPTIEVVLAPTPVPSDGYHTVDSSSPTLTQTHVLTVQSATHAQVAGMPLVTPLSVTSGLFGQWDAANDSSFIYSTQATKTVLWWLDRSPVGWNFQSVTSTWETMKPTRDVTVNGKPAVKFVVSAQQSLMSDTVIGCTAQNITEFIVCVPDAGIGAVWAMPFHTGSAGSSSGGYALAYSHPASATVGLSYAWTAEPPATNIPVPTGVTVGRLQLDAAGKGRAFINGVEALPTRLDSAVIPTVRANMGLPGVICEVLHYERALIPAEIVQVEQYLSEKWISSPTAVGDIVLTQAHNLTVANAAHTEVSDSPAFTQAHVLVAAGATHAQAVDHVAINTATNVPAADATHAIISDSPALTQLHVLVVANAAHAHVADNVTTNYVVHAPANAAHAHVADAPSITQVHILTVQSATHAHVADAPSITQLHVITVQGAAHAHAADSIAITQLHILIAQGAAHTIFSPEVSTSTEGVVAGADTYHPLISDNVALTQVHNLLVQNALHVHTAATPTLVYNVNLTVASAAHAHSADAPTLVYNIFLTVASTAHAHAVDNAVLNYVVFVVANAAHAQTVTSPFIIVDIPVLNAAHAHTASNIAITQAHFLAAVADTTHAHSVSGDLLLTQIHKLTVDSTDHLHVTDDVAFTQDHFLVVADTQHGHDADEDLALTQVHNLAVASAFHAHNTDEVGPIEVTVWLEVWSAWHAHRGEEVNLAGIVFLSDAVALYLGAQVVRAAYVGATKVWP